MNEERVPVALKRLVVERAQGCCEYCRSQARFAMQSFSTEHVEPRILDGETTLDNLALSCQGCNNHKAAKTSGVDPVSAEIVPLFHPRRHRWADRFVWSEDYARVVGVTPIGRATVDALKLNRQGLVNLRLVLRVAGEHPPSL